MKPTTPELIDGLRRRHPQEKGQWANIVEFERIDFLAVACWASMGYQVVGHEIKASRGDWLKEIKNPSKSRLLLPFCDEWFIAAPEGIVHRHEVPDNWGYLEYSGGHFKCVVQPSRLRPKYKRGSRLSNGNLNMMHFERQGFAMLARRFTYAQSDRDALMCGIEDTSPYLDAAAIATGRLTSSQREVNKAWKTQQAKHRQEWKRKGLM